MALAASLLDISSSEMRAKSVLMQFLTAQQKKSIEYSHNFDLVSNTGRNWRIHTRGSVTGNVQLFTTVRPKQLLGEYCIQAFQHRYDKFGNTREQIALPIWDHYLTQFLWLRVDEAHFVRHACLCGTYFVHPPEPVPGYYPPIRRAVGR